MNKLQELKTTTDIVKDILEKDVMARNCDSLLIVKVYNRINPEVVSMPFSFVMANLKEFRLPNPETIRRSRQKLQEKNPELASSEIIGAYRQTLEQDFKDWARGDA